MFAIHSQMKFAWKVEREKKTQWENVQHEWLIRKTGWKIIAISKWYSHLLHIGITFHFISFHHFKADFHFSDYLTFFWFPNECFGSIFHCMLLIYLLPPCSSLSLLHCSTFCVWWWWVSIIFQFKKETLIISLFFFFSRVRRAQQKTHSHSHEYNIHSIYIQAQAHILNSLRYGV